MSHKYHAKKTEYNGAWYDSKAEAKLAQDIDLLIKSGQAVSVSRQVKFNLYGPLGGLITTHRVDFIVTFADGHCEAWEYKGFMVRDFPMRRKLFEDNYPNIKYVIHSKGRMPNENNRNKRIGRKNL